MSDPRTTSGAAPSCSICGGRFWGRASRDRNGNPAHAICAGGRRYHTRPPRRLSRSRTTATKHLTREFLRSQAALLDDGDLAALADRPKTWGECRERTGPCAYVGCKHHLYLDVNPDSGSIKVNYPDLEPEELLEPCALRIAEASSQTLEETGTRMNLTRERVRQLEIQALVQIRRRTEDNR